MRRMRKLVGLLLAMVMLLSMTATAFATEVESKHTIAIPENDHGHSYEIYQIFTGDLSEKTLSNVLWGVNGTGETGEEVDATTLAALEAVTGGTSDSEKLAVITNYVDFNSTPVAVLNASNPSVEVLDGYYLIKDVSASVPEGHTQTTYVVKLVADVTIDPKDGKTESDKKVKDVNDSTGAESEWQDSADYDIGDKVPFRLRGVVASDYDKYVDYYFAFHDTESKGLTFQPDSVKVFVGETEITEGFKVVYPATDGHTFDVVFEDLKQVLGVTAGSEIFVYYESVLNENAVIGNPGNPNEMYLEFDNNPNDEQDGDEEDTGRTPDDKVVVFTYETIIDKVDENGAALPGATFVLEKYNEETKKWEAVEQVETEPGTTFTFRGLDDGKYRLTETNTPAGYNSIDPIEFEVKATHTVTQVGNTPILVETLEVTPDDIFAVAKDSGTFEKLNGTNKELASGQIYTEIVNQAGAELPETGGMGTTLFYVFGTILVIGAAVVLVTKKRMSGIR